MQLDAAQQSSLQAPLWLPWALQPEGLAGQLPQLSCWAAPGLSEPCLLVTLVGCLGHERVFPDVAFPVSQASVARASSDLDLKNPKH